ncbi:MAG TPA: PD-(D/E)XK nuclease family protein, partial [Armatimonadota bacterium]|nr:PD-(D/E)XK nuclease family protein [Armatimonadota bacterium]
AIAEDTDIPMPFADTAYPIRVWCPATLDHIISLQPPEQSPTLWDEYHTEILNGAELPILTDAAAVDSFQRLTDRLQELPNTKRHGPLRIGVHRALCYRACPRQYWYKYILQDDGALLSMQIASPDTESEDPSVINEDDETERMDGTAFGKMLHAVMERLQFSQPLSEQLPDIFLELQREQSIIPSAVEQQHIERCLTNFMAMPIYQKLQQATETFRELRFLAREDHVYIPGIIDVLAKIDDQWWILDYKTGKSFSADHVRQLALYALGVQHALGVMPSMICLAYVDATNSRNYRVETVTEELLDEARQIIKRASEGIGKDDFHPISGHQCTFCPCKEICPESMPTVLPGEASQLRFDI